MGGAVAHSPLPRDREQFAPAPHMPPQTFVHQLRIIPLPGPFEHSSRCKECRNHSTYYMPYLYSIQAV
jgi:hypothetical protein